ncbi:efflux RND transporter periplasmic adaptor subunit [Candidatus Nitrospira bockiana]
MNRRAWLFTGLVLCTLLGGGLLLSLRSTEKLGGSSAATETPEADLIRVDVAEVVPGSVTEAVKAVGTLQAKEAVTIRPEIAGRVTQVLFESGRRVSKGAVLFMLDDAELRAQAAQTEARLEEARIGYERMRQLGQEGNQFVSQEQIDQAASKLKSAKAEHALNTTRLEKTKILAPFSGHLGIRRVSPGEYVEPGQDLVTLEDLDTLHIDFKVPQTFLSRLSVGQEVRLFTDAYADEEFSGTISALSPRIDEANRAVPVQARVRNPSGKLRPGLFANVTVLLDRNDHALLIPEESVIPQGARTYVYRVVNQTARLTEVELGARERGLVQVLDGLQAGDVVVRTGQHKLQEGMRVRIVNR